MTAHILTAAEGAAVLRCEATDANLLALLPAIDAYLETATGRDWTLDTQIHEEAKSAGRMLLVRWFEDPGGMAAGGALGFGLAAVLMQLKALALELARSGTPREALEIVTSNLGREMAVDTTLTIIFNHEMASGATGSVSIQDSAGNPIAATNALDVTQKILTLTPTADLAAESAYTIVLDGAADVYGQTITESLGFWTN